MPQTTYMQRDQRRDHGFTIPDPLLTKEHGIPNACNRCHTDKDTDWAVAAVEKWYGPSMDRPTRKRARTIALAREGATGSRDNLLQLLREEKTPFWKAVATELLYPWTYDPEVTTLLLGNLTHTNALLRGTTARALDPLARRNDPRIDSALAKLLDDPVRKVRVDAAWTLRDRVDPQSKAGEDLLRKLSYNVDMPTGALQKGVYHLDRVEFKKAEDYFRFAIKLDSYSAPLRHEFAIALSMMGRTNEAIDALKERSQTLVELADKAGFLLDTRPLAMEKKATKLIADDVPELLATAHTCLSALTDWNKDALSTALRGLAETEGMKLGMLAQPLRAALTGRNASPGIFEVLYFLGRQESLDRISDHMK